MKKVKCKICHDKGFFTRYSCDTIEKVSCDCQFNEGTVMNRHFKDGFLRNTYGLTTKGISRGANPHLLTNITSS